jgi:uncharacterized membrane protein YukC
MKPKDPQMELDPGSQALQALDEFKDEEITRQQKKITQELKKDKKKKIWIITQWFSLIICIGIILYQIPALISAQSLLS